MQQIESIHGKALMSEAKCWELINNKPITRFSIIKFI